MSEEFRGRISWWREVLAFWPLVFALVATAIFAKVTWKLATEVVEIDGFRATRLLHFLEGTPNEIGDTLAGFVGSLTLVWVVASVLQQSMELRAQRREFAEMVRAQDAQVLALKAQADIFLKEQAQREEDRLEQLIDQRVERLRSDVQNYIPEKCRWKHESKNSPIFEDSVTHLNLLSRQDLLQLKEQSDADFFRLAARYMASNFVDIAKRQEGILQRPKAVHLDPVIKLLDAIVSDAHRLSAAQQQRIDNLRIEPLLNFFREIRDGTMFEQAHEVADQ